MEQHNKNAGMTLIELIVSMCVFSIASLILFTGFSSIIQRMSDATIIKNNSNQMSSYFEGNTDVSGSDIQSYKKSQVRIQFEQNQTIDIDGTISIGKLTNTGASDLQLVNFEADIHKEDGAGDNEVTKETMLQIKHEMIFNYNAVRIKYNELPDDIRKKIGNMAMSSLVYRTIMCYSYYANVWPEFKTVNSNMSVYDKETKLYMQPYFTNFYQTNSRFILYAHTSKDADVYHENAKLLYNDDNKQWYYHSGSGVRLSDFDIVNDLDIYKWPSFKYYVLQPEASGWVKLTYQ